MDVKIKGENRIRQEIGEERGGEGRGGEGRGGEEGGRSSDR